MGSGKGGGATAARALALALGIVAVEYLARRVVAPALPILAARRVDDMIATGAAYAALSWVVARALRRGPVSSAVIGIFGAARRWQAWVGALAMLVAAAFGVVDRLAWGSVSLPSFTVEPRGAIVAASATWAAPVAVLIVNGVLVPWSEEWLWRGVVQPRLVEAWGVAAGIGVTALLFSAKHAIVDASLGRALAVTLGGVALGLVARAATWKASAVSHTVANLAATSVALVFLPPAECLSVPPEPTPALRDATARAVALIAAQPDPQAVESLLTPSFLQHLPVADDVAFFRRVHAQSGACAWKCVTRVEGPTRQTGLLRCEKSSLVLTVGIEEQAPNRIDYLEVRPAGAP